jgi:cyanate lyase
MLSLLVNQVLQEPTTVEYTQEETIKLEWTAKMIGDLGKMTDADFAEKHKVSHHHVFKKRAELKIKPMPRSRSGVSKYDWPENERELFKRYTSNELAVLLDIPYASVQQRRKSLGVALDLTLKLVDAELTEAERAMREKMREKESRNADKTAKVQQLRAQGMTYHQISNATGVSLGFISTALLKNSMSTESKAEDVTAAEQSVLDITIEQLELIDKLKFTLKSQGVNKVGDLVQLTKQDLLRMPNIGRYAFADIVISLEKFGLKIKMAKLTHGGNASRGSQQDTMQA